MNNLKKIKIILMVRENTNIALTGFEMLGGGVTSTIIGIDVPFLFRILSILSVGLIDTGTVGLEVLDGIKNLEPLFDLDSTKNRSSIKNTVESHNLF